MKYSVCGMIHVYIKDSLLLIQNASGSVMYISDFIKL